METDSRKINSIRNVIFGYGNQAITLLLNFIGRTVFIQFLGEDYLGINALFADVLQMLSLADLGLGTAMTYSFYKPVAEKDGKKIAALIHFYKGIYNIIAAVVAIVGIMLIPFLKYIINLDRDIPHLYIYYLFFLANTVISYLFVYKTSIINASQKNYLISKYQAIVNTGKTFLQIILLFIFKNYFLYLAITILATLCNNLIASHKAGQLYPEIKEEHAELDSESKKTIFENIKSVFIYKVFGVLMNGTDNTLTSVIVGTVWAGVCSNYNMIITAVNNLINTLFSSVTASIGNVIATEKPQKKYEIFKMMQVICYIIASAMAVIMYTLMNDLLYVWLGEKFVLEQSVLIALICNFYITNILRTIWTYREATGLYMKIKYVMLIAAILNVILSIILGNIFGLSGIFFATAIAKLSTYFWYEPKILFKDFFDQGTKEFYIDIFKNVCLTVLLSLIIVFIGKGIFIDAWWKFFVKAIIVGIFTVVCVILAYARTPEMKAILAMGKNMLKKAHK